jgi:hypothetical protein
MSLKQTIGSLAAILLMSSCSGSWRDTSLQDGTGAGRYFAKQGYAFLDQSWSAEARAGWYFTPQGSSLVPFDWAQHLQIGDTPLFEALGRYGFITLTADPKLNPFGLPVGFVQDRDLLGSGTPTLGMTCAACHTSALEIEGQIVVIDGGSPQIDFQGFLADFDRAVLETVRNDRTFARFGRAVLRSATPDQAELDALRADLERFSETRQAWQARNDSGGLDYGHGRNDAFGVIYNEITARVLGEPGNRRDTNAPASYPVVWDGPHHDFVQWTAVASNANDRGGPMARNIGEVFGVFGDVDVSQETKLLHGYCSSARRDNLADLELWLRELTSPVASDPVLRREPVEEVALGQALYRGETPLHTGEALQCASCHGEVLSDAPVPSRDPAREIRANKVPLEVVGTDPLLAENAYRPVATGILEGRREKLVSGYVISDQEPASEVLKHVVAGALAGSISPVTCDLETSTSTVVQKWSAVLRSMIRGSAEMPETTPEERMAAVEAGVRVYKARPLNGIWAKGRYGHAGQFASIREMLLPASQRSTTFLNGCRTFDMEALGFACDPEAPDARTFSRFDTRIDGNRNIGHEFGVEMNEVERSAILAYLKVLQ